MKKNISMISIMLLSPFLLIAQSPIEERMEVRLVERDVRVLDLASEPVTGLTSDDLTVRDNGRKREIDSIEEITPTRVPDQRRPDYLPRAIGARYSKEGNTWSYGFDKADGAPLIVTRLRFDMPTDWVEWVAVSGRKYQAAIAIGQRASDTSGRLSREKITPYFLTEWSAKTVAPLSGTCAFEITEEDVAWIEDLIVDTVSGRRIMHEQTTDPKSCGDSDHFFA